MKFKGKVLSGGGIVLYESKLFTFTRTHIIVPPNAKYLPPPIDTRNYSIPKMTSYELVYFPKDDPRRFTKRHGIQIIYHSSTGEKCYCWIHTNKFNRMKALWIHKHYKWIQNNTFRNTALTILTGIIIATYVFALKQCERSEQPNSSPIENPKQDTIKNRI